MAPINGYTITPHHRQNRRRERPGSRTRRSLTRRSILTFDCNEGLTDALDTSVSLPCERTKPSPLLRHNFDKSWQRWKARQEEESAQEKQEMEARRERLLIELESEQLRLFGGDVDDDELYRLGILFPGNNEDIKERHSDEAENTISCSVPIETDAPLYIIRHRKPRRSLRRSGSWRSISLDISLSPLSADAEIAQFFSTPDYVPGSTLLTTIQHRQNDILPRFYPDWVASDAEDVPELPQSLPPSPIIPVRPEISSTPLPQLLMSEILIIASTISSPSTTTLAEDWTIVNPDPQYPPQHSNTNPSILSTPSSELETWILLSDDS